MGGTIKAVERTPLDAKLFEAGKVVYGTKCMACHNFDKKAVGPAHKDVLPKYEGKEDALKAFLKSPSPQNPKEFPAPMPNLGLKDEEINAVVHYMLNEYKKH